MTDNHETAPDSPKAGARQAPPRLPSLFGGLLLGGILAAMGGFFVFVLLAFGYTKAAETHSWAATPCTILKSAVVTTRATPHSPGLTHELDILYEYSFNGTAHQSARHRRIATRSAHESKIQSIVDQFPAGAQATCYVNPNDPATAVLKQDTRAVGYTIWFPGLFIVGGLGIMVASARNWFKARRSRNSE